MIDNPVALAQARRALALLRDNAGERPLVHYQELKDILRHGGGITPEDLDTTNDELERLREAVARSEGRRLVRQLQQTPGDPAISRLLELITSEGVTRRQLGITKQWLLDNLMQHFNQVCPD